MSLFSNENPNLGLSAAVNGAKIMYLEPITLFLSATTTSTQFFVSNDAYQVIAVKEAHGTASTSGAIQIEKLTGTQASGAGTAVLTGTMSLSGAANTVASGTVVSTSACQIAAGDRLGFVISGTMTSLANCTVTVYLQRI